MKKDCNCCFGTSCRQLGEWPRLRWKLRSVTWLRSSRWRKISHDSFSIKLN